MRTKLLRGVAAIGGLVALVSGVLAFSMTGAQAASVLTFTGYGEFAAVNGTYLDKAGVAHTVNVSAGEMLATVDGGRDPGLLHRLRQRHRGR